jgi:hypothetical protein
MYSILPTLNTSSNSSDSLSLLTEYKRNAAHAAHTMKTIKISKTSLKSRFIGDTSLNKSKVSTIDTTTKSSKTLIHLTNSPRKAKPLESLYQLCKKEEKNIKDLSCSIQEDIKNKKFAPYNMAMNKYVIREQIKLHNSNEEADKILLSSIIVAENIQKRRINCRKLQPVAIKQDLFRSTKLNDESAFKFRNMIREKVGKLEDDLVSSNKNVNTVPAIDFSDPSSLIYQSKKVQLMENMKKTILPRIKLSKKKKV